MRLIKIKYSEYKNTNQAWTLDQLRLGDKTLLVGKNASGKSRTLNIIYALARYLSGTSPQSESSEFECTFFHEEKIIEYRFSCEFSNIYYESLTIDGEKFLDRGEGGIGKIFAEKIGGGTFVEFQTPTSELAAVTRRDSIQHPFLEQLHTWAISVRHFAFGSNTGKNSLAIHSITTNKVDDRDQEKIVGIFHSALKEFGSDFTDVLIKDLSHVGYHIDTVNLGPPVSIIFQEAPANLLALLVKEKDLPGVTDQHSMSQGMFRVLSLLIHVNYFQFKETASCILIDDIGEGLDFERSCQLITLLREKAEKTNIQIVLATNDRFVMNEVPLKEWAILQRQGNVVSIRDDSNSHEIFEQFRFTGLSNFSFFEMGVINELQSNEDSANA